MNLATLIFGILQRCLCQVTGVHYIRFLLTVFCFICQVTGINYILNVSKNCPQPAFIQEGHFHRIPIDDSYTDRILPFLPAAFRFLGDYFSISSRQYILYFLQCLWVQIPAGTEGHAPNMLYW